jgi:hypothetical protein
MRDDTNVDWIHGLPFHSFDPSAYGRSVALVAFTYSTPWLALALVTVVAWAQFHRGCMCGRLRAPRRPALLGIKPAMIMFLVMAYIACSLVPSAYTRYNEGSGDVDDALRALDALATGAMGHAAQAKSAAAECSAALAVVDTHFKDHMAPALKVQRARQAAEHFGAAAEGVGGMAWKDLGDMRGYDERWSRIDTWFTALSATTYTLLILAAIAPVAARAAFSADVAAGTAAAEKFTIAAPFLALVAAWLFLAASSPATVTLAETCHDWVPTVTERVPAGGRFYFFCGVDASESADVIPTVTVSPTVASVDAAGVEFRASIEAVLALDPSLSSVGHDVTTAALKRVETCEGTGVSAKTAVVTSLGSCDPIGANLRAAREGACGAAVTGIFWNNIAIMLLAFVVFYHALRGWLWELVDWVAMGDVVYGENSPRGPRFGTNTSAKGYGSTYVSSPGADVESQIERLEGEFKGVKGDVKYVMGKVDEMVPLVRDLEAASRVNSPVGKGSPEAQTKGSPETTTHTLAQASRIALGSRKASPKEGSPEGSREASPKEGSPEGSRKASPKEGSPEEKRQLAPEMAQQV